MANYIYIYIMNNFAKSNIAQSAVAVEYTDCSSADG